MKKLNFTCLLVAFCLFSQAQDNSPFFALKLYSNLDLCEDSFELQDGGTIIERSARKLLYLSPAFTIWGKNKNFQEIELSKFVISENSYKSFIFNTFGKGYTDGEVIRNIEFAIRYEYNFFIIGSEKFQTSIGFAANPYFQKIDFEPVITSIFPQHFTSLGVDFGLVPRFNYFISDRVFFDLNLPLTISRLGYQFQRIHNPAIPLSQQKNSGYDFRFFHGDPLIRLGTGIKL